jgi:hypothetical protein
MVVKVVIGLKHYKLNPSTQNLLSWIISTKFSSFDKNLTLRSFLQVAQYVLN